MTHGIRIELQILERRSQANILVSYKQPPNYVSTAGYLPYPTIKACDSRALSPPFHGSKPVSMLTSPRRTPPISADPNTKKSYEDPKILEYASSTSLANSSSETMTIW